MGGTKKLSKPIWNGGTERGLHAIIVRMELEMCINFAQLYLRDG